MPKNILKQIGLRSWEAQEPIILSALVADLPLFFYGKHGQAKTKGAEAISRSLLPGCRFQAYDYSRVTKDEVVGVLDPTGLQKKELDYIPSPHTVWGADAVLFDEFNRANVMMGSMVHELLLDKTILGRKTSVKVTFAAANPPSNYETNYIDLATASRFVFVQTPGPNDLKKSEVEDLLLKKDAKWWKKPPDLIQKTVHRARRVVFDDNARKEMAGHCYTISEELNRFDGIDFSTRQTEYLFNLLMAAEALKSLGHYFNENEISELVMSVVPEATGLVATTSQIDYDQVENRVRQLVIGISIGDPILSGLAIDELLTEGPGTDLEGWTGAVMLLADKSEGPNLLTAIRKLKEPTFIKQFSKRRDIFNVMTNLILVRYLESVKEEDGITSSVLDKPVNNRTILELVRGL